MAARYAEDDNHVTDVFACTKSLYAATKFDDANVGHDPDEDFLKNLGKMRHSKATLRTFEFFYILCRVHSWPRGVS